MIDNKAARQIKRDTAMLLVARIAELEDMIKRFNPCGHTGFESMSCGICGYPDSRKLIQHLTFKVVELQGDQKVSASMLAKQCDLAREAETRVMELEALLKEAENKCDTCDKCSSQMEGRQ